LFLARNIPVFDPYDERDRKLEDARKIRAKTPAAKSSEKSKVSLTNQGPTAYLIPAVAEDGIRQEATRATL
jgi:hypothetical protein